MRSALIGLTLFVSLALVRGAESPYVHEETVLKEQNVERLFSFGEVVLCETGKPQFDSREGIYRGIPNGAWHCVSLRKTDLHVRALANPRTFRASQWYLVRRKNGEWLARLDGEIYKSNGNESRTSGETRFITIDKNGKQQNIDSTEPLDTVDNPLPTPNASRLETDYKIRFQHYAQVHEWEKPDQDDAPETFSLWKSAGREKSVPLQRFKGDGVQFESQADKKSFTVNNGLPSNRVSAVCLQKDHAWVGFFDAPLTRINLKTGEIHPLPAGQCVGASLITPLADGTWLVGTFSEGLFRLTPAFNLLPIHAEKCRINAVCLHADRLWVATSAGLAVYRKNK